jgi:hypothetical protein
MEHTVEVFYVSAQQQLSSTGQGVRQDLAKFFSKDAAEKHAASLDNTRGHSAVAVDMRVEAWKNQAISHRPDSDA